MGRHIRRQRFNAGLGLPGDPVDQRHAVDILVGLRRSARLVESIAGLLACHHFTAGTQAQPTIAGGIHIAAGHNPPAVVELQKLDTSRGRLHCLERGVQQHAAAAGLVQHGLHRRGHGIRLEHHAMPLLTAGRLVRVHAARAVAAECVGIAALRVNDGLASGEPIGLLVRIEPKAVTAV